MFRNYQAHRILRARSDPETDFCFSYRSRVISIALPALLDVGFYFLVPISHAATSTGRGAYCLFLNVGN